MTALFMTNSLPIVNDYTQNYACEDKQTQPVRRRIFPISSFPSHLL